MADANIRAVITAEDKASATLSKFKGDVDGVGQSTQNMNNNILGGAAAAAGALMAAKAVVIDFGSSAVRAFADNQRIFAELTRVIETTGKSGSISAKGVQELATQIENYSGFSDEAIMSGQSVLLQFDTMSKDTLPAASRLMADLARVMGTDTTSAAQTLGLALTDPELAVRRLRAAHVVLSDAQKDTLIKLKATGDESAYQTELFKILNAHVGGAAETYGKTLAGSLDIAKEKFDDTKEAIGAQIATALTPLLLKLIPIIEKVTDWIEHHQKLTLAIIAGIGVFFALVAIVTTIGVVVAAVGVIFAGTAAAVALAIGAIIAAFVFLLVMIITHVRQIEDWFGRMYQSAANAVGQIKAWLGNLAGSIGGILAGVYDALTYPFRRAFDVIKQGVNDVKGFLNKLNPFSKSSPSLVELVTSGTDEIAKQYGQMFDDIGGMAKDFRPTVAPALTPSLTTSSGGSTVNSTTITIAPQIGVYTGSDVEMRSLTRTIVDAIKDLANQKNMTVTDYLAINRTVT